MVITNMHTNVNIISQKSEQMLHEPICGVPFELLKPDKKHKKRYLGILQHIDAQIKGRFVQAKHSNFWTPTLSTYAAIATLCSACWWPSSEPD